MSDCPAGKTRVAMANMVFPRKNCLTGGGAGVYCCQSLYSLTKAIPNPLLDAFGAALKDFVSAPTCPTNVPNAISKRYSEDEDGYFASRHASYGDIAIRATPTTNEISTVLTAVMGLVSYVRSGNSNPWIEHIQTIWTNGVKATFPYFAMATLSVFLKTWIGSNLVLFKASDVANTLLYMPHTMNERIGNATNFVSCSISHCQNNICGDPNDEDRPSQALIGDSYNDAGDFTKRWLQSP